jgi:hypothetical protein
MELAPIVLFVYNRAGCTLQTLEHLKKNILADRSKLFIFSDGPKKGATEEELNKITLLRKLIRKEQWCKDVHIFESPVNLGLADSIINGVTEVVNKFGKIIVLEDDLLTSVHYLAYMNEGLCRFEKEDKVFQIVGYTAPVRTHFKNDSYFLPMASSLGWGTWARAWKYFEINPQDYILLKGDKKLRKKFDLGNSYPYSDMLIRQMETGIDSWAIRWWWSVFKQNGVGLFPDRTLIACIGFDPEATHTKTIIKGFNKYWIKNYRILNFPSEVKVNISLFNKVRKYDRRVSNLSIIGHLKTLTIRLIKKCLKILGIKNNITS